MHARFLGTSLLLAASLLTAACDGRGTTGIGDARLSEADAAALNRAIFSTGASFASGAVPVGARGSRTVNAAGSSSFTFAFGTEQRCTPSGSVAVSGVLTGGTDAVAHTSRLQANLSVRHQDCAVALDNGRSLRLNGDPGIEVTLDASAGDAGLSQLHSTEQGGFTWQLNDGSSGRCTLDVQANLDPGGQTVRLTGAFCGYPVDASVPLDG
jgi:hypothetical protein